MTTGGFQLHSWSSNDPELCHYIELDGSLNPCSQVNVLGVQWDTKTDQLTYRNNARHDANLDVLTKRAVVQQLARVYDPLGFIAPVLTRAKLYVQELWKEHYDWDQSLSAQLRQQWHHIHSDISAATTTIYDRKYFTHNITSDTILELHAFSDASQSAYGGVVYLLDVTNKQTTLVMSESRVAPVKQLTIPRLELLGVLIATKLLQFVLNTLCKQFNFTKKVIWTDSQIVLHWSRSNKRLPIFVSNRIKAIRALDISDYKYCPTLENPADLVSRGVSNTELSSSELWWRGPSWLPLGDWPICQIFDSAVLSVMTDLTTNSESNATSTPSVTVPSADLTFMNPSDYSSLKK